MTVKLKFILNIESQVPGAIVDVSGNNKPVITLIPVNKCIISHFEV